MTKTNIEELAIIAMRTAIRQDHRSKQWAKVNCEDNFCLAVYNIAEGAAMDSIIATLDDPKTVKWLNEMCSPTKKLEAFVLTTCREMYSVLRK